MLDESAELGAKARRALLCGSYGAKSNIDEEIIPDNAIDVFKYIPRGIQISLLAPFPSTWLDHSRGLLWKIGVSEIILLYIFLPGMFIALFRSSSNEKILTILFIFSFLVFFGFTTANLGTLHRARYIYIVLIILIGLLVWLALIRDRWKINSKPFIKPINKFYRDNSAIYKEIIPDRKKMLQGGITVAILTSISYLGFFFRDVIMAYKFGFDKELDMFFIAMLIPMFFVNIMSIPFGEATIPEYMRKYKNGMLNIRTYVMNHAFFITLLLSLLIVISALFSTQIIDLFSMGFTDYEKVKINLLFYTALPILLFSGLVILGNSILNSENKYNISASYQLFPPFFSILFLLFLGKSIGVISVIIGMLFGQIMNYIFVNLYLSRKNILLLPIKQKGHLLVTDNFKKQFLSLCLVSLFFQIIILINNSIASNLESGSISSLNIGLKFIFFITGVITTVMTMVILPYFTRQYTQNKILTARHELINLIIFSTFVSTIFCTIFYLLSGHIVSYIFNISNFPYRDILLITDIIRLGIIQVPFFTCLMLLVKFCIAFSFNKEILVSQSIGLIINIILNLYLAKTMGVTGIALGTSFSIFINYPLCITCFCLLKIILMALP